MTGSGFYTRYQPTAKESSSNLESANILHCRLLDYNILSSLSIPQIEQLSRKLCRFIVYSNMIFELQPVIFLKLSDRRQKQLQNIQVLFRKDELQLTINIQQQKDHHEDPQVPAKGE